MPDEVCSWLAKHAPELTVVDNGQEVATVADAAAALDVEPGRIAKTLAIRVDGRIFLIVARGDARLDNAKCKRALGGRPRFLDADETYRVTGHPVGGVCPFGLASDLTVYCDVSLRDYVTVFPAAGSRTTSVEVAPERLGEMVGNLWIDVCRLPDPADPADSA